MLKVRAYSRELSFHDVELNPSDIRHFSVNYHKEYTKKGTFKKFTPNYYIRLNDGKLLNVFKSDIELLKEVLKGFYTKEKYTNVEYKNGYAGERKATDWTYTMIPEKINLSCTDKFIESRINTINL